MRTVIKTTKISWVQKITIASLKNGLSLNFTLRKAKNAAIPNNKTIAPILKLYQFGHAIWWYSAPMAVFSFLEENDLSGKKVVLFCSHGTGGLASSVKDISAVLPDSKIETNVLGVYRDDIPECQETINNWLEEIGY